MTTGTREQIANAADDASHLLSDLADVLRADDATPWGEHEREGKIRDIRTTLSLMTLIQDDPFNIVPTVTAALDELEGATH